MRPNGMDITVLVILGIFVFLGWKKGLVKMGFRMLSHLASLILAWVLHPHLAAFLEKTPLYERLVSSGAEQTQASQSTGFLQQIMEQSVSGVEQAMTEYFARLLLNGISFLVILVLARVLLLFAGKILNFVASLPILGFFNRGLGMAIGLLEGLLVVCILFTIFYVVPPLRESKPLGYAIEQSMVARELYLHNPVLQILMPEDAEKSGK